MTKFLKRPISILLAVLMIAGIFTALPLTAYAAPTETLLTTITATGIEQASYSTANVATVSFSYLPDCGSAYLATWGWWGYGITITVAPVDGYTITKCVFYDNANHTATDSSSPFEVETTEDDKTPLVNGNVISNSDCKGIKKIEVYGYATPAHTHNFSYTAEGDTITATCTATGCDLTDNKVTLKIVPNSVLYYDDNQPKEASLEGLEAFNDATGKSISTDNIAYYKGDTNVTAQIKAGSGTSIKVATYTARLDVEGVRAVATFRLTAKPQPHTHSFTYSADGNVITATCIGTTGTCDLTNKQATLTLNAPEHATYDDGKNANATITGEIPGVTTPTINYRRSDTPLSSAPTDAGTYTAWCQLGNATARVEYTVAKAVNPGYTTLPHAVENLVYTGEEQELITAGVTSTGQIAYTAGTDPENEPDVTTGGMPYSYSVPKMTNAGTYYVWCKLDGGKNYTSLGAQKIEVTIAKANPTYTVPADLTATYGDTLSDVILPEGWSWADDTQSVGNAGTKTFKATFTPEDTTNYNTVSDIDVTVTVEKADIDPTVSIENRTYGEKASDPSVEGNSGNGAVTYTYAAKGSDEFVAEAPTNAGEYTVKATIAETANYNAAVATADFEIEKALLTVTVKNQTVNYGSPAAQGKYTVKGLVDGDTVDVKLYTKIATNEVKATVKASANYKVKVVSGILTIKGAPIAKAQPSGSNMLVSYTKVQKADGYDIFAGYCGSGSYPLAKTIKGNSVAATKLTKIGGKAIDTKKNVFLYVVAYKMVNGKKVTLVRSASLHIAGANTKYTNAKSIKVAKTSLTLAKGKTTTLKPTMTLVSSGKKLISCTDKFRYASCNKSIAKVDASGKITAVGKGTVNLYVYATNGVKTKVVVTVK